MTIHDVWYTLKAIGLKAWSAVGASSAFVTLFITLFFKDYLKDRDVPQWIGKYGPLITLIVCALLISTAMLISKLISAWRAKNNHVRVGTRKSVTYTAHTYKPGSDLKKLSKFAHDVFKGDTMKAEIVQQAVKKGAATGLRLTDEKGDNVGFLDVFHFTKDVMERWKDGELPEDTLREQDFQKIPAKGGTLELAIGAIYLKPGVERSVAHHFANMGELFLRKSFPKFGRIDLYATIFKPDGKRIAGHYKFEVAQEAKDRPGRYANGHDLLVRKIFLDQMPHLIAGVGGQRHVIIEMAE